MNKWVMLASLAYAIGGLIEGVNAASELSRSTMKRENDADSSSPEPAAPFKAWQVLLAITAVSVCGAFSWPCRLIHRSLKSEQDCRN